MMEMERGPATDFPILAQRALDNPQLQRNVRHATEVITAKRNRVVAELPQWDALRLAGSAIRDEALARLPDLLEQFERNCTAAGGQVHWAADAAEAQAIVLRLVQESGSTEVIKIKSMTTAEIALNDYLEAHGVGVHETDLAELILQLGKDQPSHIVVPALHRNRHEIRELFLRAMDLPELPDTPQALAEAARVYLRARFLRVKTAICGANFLIADTGAITIVESEGNGRMCLTLPDTLIAICGIEKVLPRFTNLGVLLQTLPRSATGERMNPYNSIWRGVVPGDGPQHFHVVLLDNGRSGIRRDAVARQTLKCIRCGACQNVCPVYRSTGGHAYNSVYGGPIGAILTPQLEHLDGAQSLPFASSLCGACMEVCPVAINIPQVLTHLRGAIVQRRGEIFTEEALAMRAASRIFQSPRLFRMAQRAARLATPALTARDGWMHRLPGMASRWTEMRDLCGMPPQTFREWFAQRTPKPPVTR